jgi:hypothetical protein
MNCFKKLFLGILVFIITGVTSMTAGPISANHSVQIRDEKLLEE